MSLIEQEVSAERFIAIPEEVRTAYSLGALYRAHWLERAFDNLRQDLLQIRGSESRRQP